MKTKSFLLATAGSTVDGRTIDDKMIEEMASSYDPKTYGARLNMEHIRGWDPKSPFRAYGDVLELSTGDVEVNMNGENEKRLGLFGVFDVDESAKQLNEDGQKVYPSIEIEPNFGGKGFAYMMGCALTDSPAAIATEKLQFNRSMPGTVTVSAEDCGIDSALMEFAEQSVPANPETGGLVAAATAFFNKFTGEEKPPAKPETKSDDQSAELLSQLPTLFTDMAKKIEDGFAAQARATNEAIEKVDSRVTGLSKKIDDTPDGSQKMRSKSGDNKTFKTDC